MHERKANQVSQPLFQVKLDRFSSSNIFDKTDQPNSSLDRWVGKVKKAC